MRLRGGRRWGKSTAERQMERHPVGQPVIANADQVEAAAQLPPLELKNVQEIRRADVVAQPAEAERFGILGQHRLEIGLAVGEQLLAGQRTFDLAEGTQRRLSVQG